MQVNLEQNSSHFGRGKQHKIGKQWASLISWEGQQERNVAILQAPASFHVRVVLHRDLLQPWGQDTSPSRAPLLTQTSAIQWDPETLCDPVPLLHSSWQRETWPASLCNVVLYSSRGETITVTGHGSYGTSQPWHTIAGLCLLELIPHAIAQHLQRCLGLVQALCPLENRLPTHTSSSMSC